MAEAAPATPATTPAPGTPATTNGDEGPGFDFREALISIAKRGDIIMALAVVSILVILILPMPKWGMDVSLAFSITFSVLILMVALFVERPLEFNAFPTILLLATMVRLALNLASTRLILTHGHEGTNAAGQVIQAFGGFVMGNNFVIGIIVFGILVIVNFIVITKGSGRIAEVSARFTLDAMPGKQMAIDADLSTGLIDEDEARTRRKDLEDESTFFGAMDGAAKFVRGDAIAGILITFINIIGGMIIGVVQKDLSFAQAADLYTRLTVGDGLVSQLPALVISTAAGLVVTRAVSDKNMPMELMSQLLNQPYAFVIASVALFFFGMIPGLPHFPFFLLSLLTGGVAYYRLKENYSQRKTMEVDAPEVLRRCQEE